MALIAHWPLDGRLDDVSGNGYKLENINCEIMSDGPFGKCYNVTGSNEIKVKTPGNIVEVLNSNKFSISIRFKIKNKYNINVEGFLTSGNTYTANRILHIGLRGNKLTFAFYSDDLNSEIDIETGVWYHAVFILNDGIQYIYINGSLDSSRVIKSRLNVQELVFRFGRYKNYSTDVNISNCRIYDHALSDYEIIKDMNEPILELDFKGSIPPTVNWLDSESKGLLRLDTENGGIISREGFNKFKITKRNNGWLPGPEFKPNFSKFTLSYKIRVLEGILKTVGGHIDTNILNNGKQKWFIDGVENKTFGYAHSGALLSRTYLSGDILEVSFTYESETIPSWASRGIGIQLNRGLGTHVVGEIYDIQIEEGLIATPFCTWSRDYMQIPDKSSYRDSIQSVNQAGFGLPSYKLENNKPLGSKGVLTFDYNNALKLDNIPPLPKFSTSMVFTPTEFISTDVNNGQMCPIFSIAKFKSSNTDPKRFSVIYNTTLKKLTILYDNNSADCVIDRIININETVFIVVTLSSEGIIIYINGTKFSTNITNPIGVTTYDLILGKRNPNTVSSYKFELSDFKMYPYVFTDEEVANEYKKLKNRVKSMASAFANIPTLNVEVPRLWENNPNTIGIDCFSNNPNIPETQAIPIGWGGAFKQPDTSILSVGTTTDMLVTNPEEVIYIDPFLDSVPLHTLIIEDTQTNTESNLTLIKKSKF